MGNRSPSSARESDEMEATPASHGFTQIKIIGNLGRLPSGSVLDSVQIQTPKTLRQVLSELGEEYGIQLRRDSILVLINGVEANALSDLETVVTSEDKVVFIPMFHGG